MFFNTRARNFIVLACGDEKRLRGAFFLLGGWSPFPLLLSSDERREQGQSLVVFHSLLPHESCLVSKRLCQYPGVMPLRRVMTLCMCSFRRPDIS